MIIQAWNCISEQAQKLRRETEEVESKRNGGNCNSVGDKKGLSSEQETSKGNDEEMREIENEERKLKKNCIWEDNNNSAEQVRSIADYSFVAGHISLIVLKNLTLLIIFISYAIFHLI